MLDRKNFRRRHERGLRAVFHCYDRGLQSDDGFPAANISLKQAIHRRRFFEVGDNFREDALLRLCRLERQDAFQRLADAILAYAESQGIFLSRGAAVQPQAELVEKKLFKDQPLLRRRAKRVQCLKGFRRLRKMRANNGVAARGIAQPRAQPFRQDIRHLLIDKLHRRVQRAANLLGAERADGLINRHDAPDFRGIHLLAVQQLDLRIDHLQPCGPHPVDFHFAVKNQELSWFQATFEVAPMKKLAGKLATSFVLYKQVVNGVAAEAHVSNGLAAHDPRSNRVGAVRLNVLDLRKMDAVFVTKRKVAEQIFERMNAALREQFGALRADAFDHAHFGAEAHRHGLLFISLRAKQLRQARNLRRSPAYR